MELLSLLLLVFIILMLCCLDIETLIMSPPKRNMPLDLRCEPPNPKLNTGPFRQSTIDYYYRPKCLNF